MKLDEHFMRLIAIGASVAANCEQCLEINLARAIECGADDDELAQAIWVGRMVRKGAASNLDKFAADQVKLARNSATSAVEQCNCES